MMPLKIAIGYDPREADAFKVCEASIKAHASIPTVIRKLDLENLCSLGLYSRKHRIENGQMIDEIDGRPFSTEFAFSRFLIPYLSFFEHGWTIFCDCDFLFTDDIAKLIPLLDDTKAVMVVKQNHRPIDGMKMDGQSQKAYPRKNWSSFIAWNCSHPSNEALTKAVVHSQTGRWLHGFSWIKDYEIGELPQTWNWLSGVSEPLPETPIAIHFTNGTPDMAGHENSPYADLWRDELNRLAQKELAS